MGSVTANGDLGPFEITQMLKRSAHTSIAIGNYVYVIGGVDDASNPLKSIERAVIQ